MFKHTRFRFLADDCLRKLHREIKVALTPIPAGKKWVFLVGCYNSGTTLLAEMLGQHPEISALPTEGHFITDQFVKDYEVGLPRMWVDREDLFTLDEKSGGPDPDRVKKEWAMRLDNKKKIFLEKSPPNVPKMLWLERHFENPVFIGIVRNGYAVAEGISRKGNPRHLKSGWPIEKSAYQWSRSNEVMLENAKKVKRFKLVTYEDLTEQTYSTLSEITDFLEVERFTTDMDGKRWAIHERKGSVKNLNNENISRLTKNDIEIIKSVAGEMLVTLGYDEGGS